MSKTERLRPGDVIVAPYPYVDLSDVKKRPALVLAVHRDLVCLMLTSKLENGYRLVNWRAAGLTLPTAARADRLFTISKKVAKKLGHLDKKDFRRVLTYVRQTLPA